MHVSFGRQGLSKVIGKALLDHDAARPLRVIGFRQRICSGLQIDGPRRRALLHVKLVQNRSIRSFQPERVLAGQRAVFNRDGEPPGCMLHFIWHEPIAYKFNAHLIARALLRPCTRV
jgi:hypothetical protein